MIDEQRVNAEWALQQVFDQLASVFDSVEDPYLRERKGDLADVVGRLRMNLTPGGSGFRDVLGQCESPCVLVADELPPSVAAQLDWTKIPGVHHQRGQPHLSHGDSGAVASRAGGRRPARRDRQNSAGDDDPR